MATRTNKIFEDVLHQIVDSAQLQSIPMDAELPPEETSSDRVATLLDLAAGDDRAYVAVYRINKGQREYCRRYQPTEFEDGSFDMIRETFGSGEYELRLYGTNPSSGKFVVRRLTRISMADMKNNPEQNAIPSGLSQMVQTISQGQQQMLDAIVQMKQQPQRDPMEEMTKMLSMMTMMREAMGMNQMHQKSSIGEVVDAIKELRGAAAEVLPEKDSEPESLMGMLPKVLEIVSQSQSQNTASGAMQMQPSMSMQPGQSGILSTVTLPPTFAATADNQTTQDDDDMNPFGAIKLRGYAKNLCEFAEKNAPIDQAAQYVYENIPDDLIDIMETDAWFAVFAAVYSAVKPHREYLQKVRDAALKMFEDSEGDVQAA
jgi:hypothetical protein